MGKPAKIIVVEDEAGDVYLLEKALKQRQVHYELTCFEDGEEALSGLREEEVPDLILVDLNLPRRGGFDVLRSLRTRPALVRTPIAVFTSSETLPDRKRASLIGADRFIHKPTDLNEFLTEVGRAVEELLTRGRTD
jgi:CheY-like chemotaxis protein